MTSEGHKVWARIRSWKASMDYSYFETSHWTRNKSFSFRKEFFQELDILVAHDQSWKVFYGLFLFPVLFCHAIGGDSKILLADHLLGCMILSHNLQSLKGKEKYIWHFILCCFCSIGIHLLPCQSIRVFPCIFFRFGDLILLHEIFWGCSDATAWDFVRMQWNNSPNSYILLYYDCIVLDCISNWKDWNKWRGRYSRFQLLP